MNIAKQLGICYNPDSQAKPSPKVIRVVSNGSCFYTKIAKYVGKTKGGIKMKAVSTKEAVARLREFGPTCSPSQLASVLGGQPYKYTVQAKHGKLPYDHDWSGRWLRIYTESVIRKITAV